MNYDDEKEAIPEPSTALLELLSATPGSEIILHLTFGRLIRVKAHLQEQADESHSLLY